MRGFGGFLTFLIIFKLYNGGLERWAENPHVSNAETVMAHFKKTMKRIIYLLTIVTLCSCGQPAVHKHLTDEFYLTAPDLIEQLSVSYHYSGASYSNLVNETVVAVGYNDNFIIVKQRPTNIDTTLYYIIDINEIKKERETFVSKTDTIRYYSNYKDIHGKDSIGPEQTHISTSKFSPQTSEPLTYKAFKIKRKQLNIPENLVFTIKYEDFSGKKNEP